MVSPRCHGLFNQTGRKRGNPTLQIAHADFWAHLNLAVFLWLFLTMCATRALSDCLYIFLLSNRWFLSVFLVFCVLCGFLFYAEIAMVGAAKALQETEDRWVTPGDYCKSLDRTGEGGLDPRNVLVCLSRFSTTTCLRRAIFQPSSELFICASTKEVLGDVVGCLLTQQRSLP
jgi:hypothetical protein